jgi:hypothetical protein
MGTYIHTTVTIVPPEFPTISLLPAIGLLDNYDSHYSSPSDQGHNTAA